MDSDSEEDASNNSVVFHTYATNAAGTTERTDNHTALLYVLIKLLISIPTGICGAVRVMLAVMCGEKQKI